jgi:glycine/D-amino acid oxidase-like deaminating enzyme
MTAQACIVGGGVIGCAVGFELRKRGLDVTVLDKNGEVGHGSTSASCGIVRRFYSQAGMTAMAHEGARIWADWAGYLGPIDEEPAVFRKTGMAFVLPELTDELRERAVKMQEMGVPAVILTAPELKERFPFLDVSSQYPPKSIDDPSFLEEGEESPIGGAVYEEDAGYVVSPGTATHNLRLAGEREGVTFLLNREVRSVSKGGERRFVLELSDGSALEADVVVNASGPHSGRVNARAAVELPLETRPLVREVHALDNPLRGTPQGQALPIVGDLDAGIYFRPESGDRALIVGTTDPPCDELEWTDDPDGARTTLSDRYRQRQCLRAMRRFPDLRLGPMKGVVSLYDVTVQDWYPIVDRTDRPGYYVCIGTSGSSFKTAPVLGALVAEMVVESEQGRDVDTDPIQLELPRSGLTVDTRFLSRNRAALESSDTVIG